MIPYEKILQKLLYYTVYGLVAFLLAVVIGDVIEKKSSKPTLETKALSDIALSHARETIPSAGSLSLDQAKADEPQVDRVKINLTRHTELRKKALLKDDELAEKQRLLSQLKTVQRVESKLSSNVEDGSFSLNDRFSMLDYLEDCITWKDNPIRNEVIDSIERTFETKNFIGDSKEYNRTVIGDKIELFTILAQEIPERARFLQEKITDPQLTKIIGYAIKRLALSPILKGEIK